MFETRPIQFFKWCIILFALLVSAFACYHVSFSRITEPFLLLALAATFISSRCPLSLPRGRGQLLLTDTFTLLALLLFGGDAAILFAALTTLCVSLRHRTDQYWHLVQTALAVLATALLVWGLRLEGGLLLENAPVHFSLNLLFALSLAALIQALFNSLTVETLYRAKTSKWRLWGGLLLWSVIVRTVGAFVAVAVVALIELLGFNISIAICAALFIAYYAFSNYLSGVAARLLGLEQAVRQDIALRQNLDRFRSAFNYASIGMALVSEEGRWLQVNSSLCALLGYTEAELLKTDFLAITYREDVSAALTKIKGVLGGHVPSCQMEKRYIHKNGELIWVSWSVSLARGMSDSAVHLIFQIQDITDRKRAEERLLHDALHDALTGLPNRALFTDHLKLAMNRQRRRDASFAVLYLDLDRFKTVNDSLGHIIGDQLLVEVARRLRQCSRPADTLARLGGDEFIILLEDVQDANDAIMIAERLQSALSAPFNLSGREILTTASIGIALYSDEYQKPEEMIRDADTAMYRAKSQGKARHELFNRTMHDEVIRRLQLETDLRRAIENNELFLQYQPVIDIRTGKVGGFEALVRWDHPRHGFIPPSDFIPLAEETGLIIPIGEWVLRRACHQLAVWQMNPLINPQLFMSVNLSGKQFSQPNLIGKIVAILQETTLDPRHLKLEITESIVMDNIENAATILNHLKSLGLQLSIDDFGTGYSSLSYLHRFPIDYLKIDRSFVSKMVKNNENLEIVRTIISLAKNLNMEVIAEGIETNAQLAFLRKLGCEYGQGYLFSKPLHVEPAEEFLINNAEQNSLPVIPAELTNLNRIEAPFS